MTATNVVCLPMVAKYKTNSYKCICSLIEQVLSVDLKYSIEATKFDSLIRFRLYDVYFLYTNHVF